MTNLQTFSGKITFSLSEAESVINQVEAALRGETHPVAKGIMHCIHHRTPAFKLIKDLKEWIREDESTMIMLLGMSLATEIDNL